MKFFRKINQGIGKIMDNVTWILMALLAIVVLFQVVNRNIFHFGAIWTEEVARYLFVWVIMAASVAAVERLQHITVTAVFQLWPCKTTDIIKVIGDVFTIVFYAYFTYATAYWTLGSVKISTEITRIPIWIVYIMLPLCGLFMTMLQVEHLVTHIKEIDTHHKEKGDAE